MRVFRARRTNAKRGRAAKKGWETNAKFINTRWIYCDSEWRFIVFFFSVTFCFHRNTAVRTRRERLTIFIVCRKEKLFFFFSSDYFNNNAGKASRPFSDDQIPDDRFETSKTFSLRLTFWRKRWFTRMIEVSEYTCSVISGSGLLLIYSFRLSIFSWRSRTFWGSGSEYFKWSGPFKSFSSRAWKPILEVPGSRLFLNWDSGRNPVLILFFFYLRTCIAPGSETGSYFGSFPVPVS